MGLELGVMDWRAGGSVFRDRKLNELRNSVTSGGVTGNEGVKPNNPVEE